MIVVAPGANDRVTEDILDKSMLAGIRFVLAQLEIPLASVIKAAKLARQEGAVFILDPAPARSLPRDLLAHVELAHPNESEAVTLLGVRELGDPLEAAVKLKALGPKGVVLKLGGEGAVLLEEDQPILVPAYEAVPWTLRPQATPSWRFRSGAVGGKVTRAGGAFCLRRSGDLGDAPWRATGDGLPP